MRKGFGESKSIVVGPRVKDWRMGKIESLGDR